MAPPEGIGLAAFNALPDARPALLACCSSRAWAAALAERRPYSSVAQLYEAADEALAELAEADIDDALAGHPRIGERPASSHSAWSSQEQSGVVSAADRTRAELAAGNREYEERFGHVYLVCASGRTGDELVAVLRGRLGNDAATERRVVRSELGKINRIRLERLIGPHQEGAT
jgi:2-oxo-4-hydroxy-4-carboxy-5-ureidoimidazoline decarboxylase